MLLDSLEANFERASSEDVWMLVHLNTTTAYELDRIVCGGNSTPSFTHLRISADPLFGGPYLPLPHCITFTSSSIVYMEVTWLNLTRAPRSLITLVADHVFVPEINQNWNTVLNGELSNLTHFEMTNSNFKANQLPNPLPGRLTVFKVANSPNIQGTIPPSFLSEYTPASDLLLDLSGTGIHGSIPASLFASMMGPSLPNLTVLLDNTQLAGALPSGLFAPNHAALSRTSATFKFSIRKCHQIVNPIPADLFGDSAAPFTSSLSSFSLNLGETGLTGDIPPGLISDFNITATERFELDLTSSGISGTIPSTLLSKKHSNFSVNHISLRLDHTSLVGSIPSDLFGHVTVLDTLSFSATDTALLADPLPSSFDIQAPNGLNLFQFFLTGSGARGPLSPGLFASFGPPGTPLTSQPLNRTSGAIMVSFVDTKLGGSIPPNLFSTASLNESLISLLFVDSNISGSIPSSWDKVHFHDLNFQNNPNLAGTLPSSLFTSTSTATHINFANTQVRGNLPIIRTPSLTHLMLSNTLIDFCTNPEGTGARPNWSAPSSTAACSLRNTSACACLDKYPSLCTRQCSFAPVQVCSPTTYPGPGFYCLNGIWTADASVDTPVLVIPPGASETIVNANISSPTIVFSGIGNTLIINQGCTTNLTSITIELTQEELKKLGKSNSNLTLIVYAGTDRNCSNSGNVTVKTTLKNDGCRKVKATKINQNSSTLNAVFTLDNSRCNLWWIILVSVIAGILVLGIIAVLLLMAFSPAFRTKIRPFSGSRRGNLDL